MTKEIRDRIVEHLKQGAKKRKHYFKSGKIAEALGLTAREVGHHMVIIGVEYPDVQVEKYSYSRSTTWKVTVTDARRKKTAAAEAAA